MRSSLFINRESPIHRWHPLTKAMLTLLGFLVAGLVPDEKWVLAYFAFVQLPLAALARIFKEYLRAVFVVIWPFVLSLSLIQGFFNPGESVLFSLGAYSFTLEGLQAGLSVALRIMLALGATLQLMLTTRPDRLMLALRELGLPNAITYIVLTALQIFPRFQDRANVILDAQQARGLEMKVNIFRRIPLLVPMVSPLILGSIVEVEERAMALETRAFNHPGEQSQLETLQDTVGQRILRWVLLLLSLVLVVLRAMGRLGA